MNFPGIFINLPLIGHKFGMNWSGIGQELPFQGFAPTAASRVPLSKGGQGGFNPRPCLGIVLR